MHRNAAAVNTGITAWIDRTIGSGAGTRGGTPGDLPARPIARTAPVDPVALAANESLLAATPGLVDAYVTVVDPVPGLGDGSNAVPVSNEVLRTLANLVGHPAIAAHDRRPYPRVPGR